MPQAVGSSFEVVGVGSDGQIHRLLLPTDAAGWAALKGRVLAHQGSRDFCASVLAWSAGGQWAASAAADSSLLLHVVSGTDNQCSAPQVLPLDSGLIEDQEAPDDASAAALPDALAAAAEAEAFNAGAPIRQATLQTLQGIQAQLMQVLDKNAAAAAEDRLSEIDLVLDQDRLQRLRAQVDAEVAALLADTEAELLANEIKAIRMKTTFWDSMQVKSALCTGLKSGDAQVWNFPLACEEETKWEQVAEARRKELLEGTASGAGSISNGEAAPATMLASVGSPHPCDGITNARLADVGVGELKAADLLYPELEVTLPQKKLTQVELYRRMVWELKTKFNEDFDKLVKQKHADADRLADLAARMDELIRELVKIHMVLHLPGLGAAQDSGASAAATPTFQRKAAGSTVTAAGDAGDGGGSAEQLAAELSAERLTAHWSPAEDLEEMLFQVKPEEIKAPKYMSPAEQARVAAEEAAAEEARRKAAADDSGLRALKQMMGGHLERVNDEVAELAASRPAWMSGNPADFSEEQLREYKEHCSKEQAAIEDRLKRKAVMETELRTLKATADDIATKFDQAVAALALKRLDVLEDVTWLECRQLRLLADYEVAAKPEGLDVGMWERFVQYRAARGRLELDARQQATQVFWLQRQQELLQGRQADLSTKVSAASEALEALRTRRHNAVFDVHLQLRLKQGQVECSASGVSACAEDALLVSQEQVAAVNDVILSKGAAKLDLLRQMKEFKRGIYQLEWENKKCDMEAEDVISLTQQLQLLHVTKSFQQMFKANGSKLAPPAANARSASSAGSSAGNGGLAGAVSNMPAGKKELQSLENLFKVREALHVKAVQEKRRQLRHIQSQIHAKARENAAAAIHLKGLETLAEDRARLEGPAHAADTRHDKTMHSLMMQSKLRDIAAAQAAEIAAAQAELAMLQERSLPFFSANSQAAAAAAAVSSNMTPTNNLAAGAGGNIRQVTASAGGRPGGLAANSAALRAAAGVSAVASGAFVPTGRRVGLKAKPAYDGGSANVIR
eukprot:gene10178-10338_t